MKVSTRFTIAIHTLICIAYFGESYKVTSSFISSSVNVNPVIIRRILGQLKDAGIVKVEAGVGGASIIKNLSDITLLDIFYAVESIDDSFFHFHDNPNSFCPVGNSIHNVLDKKLIGIQQAMENSMKSITLESLVEDAKNQISKNQQINRQSPE